MEQQPIVLNGELPGWARAIGLQLVEDLIETHMSMPQCILAARYRLEVSERLGPRRRLRYVLENKLVH